MQPLQMISTVNEANLTEPRLLKKAGWLDRTKVLVPAILALAFLTRFLVRFSYGEDYFWKNSYSLFYELSQSIAQGRGLCYEWVGLKCAHRPPVYPSFLLISMIFGKSYITIVVLQSLVGAATALCAYLIAKELFDKTAGVIATSGVALYPYFVMHDTALQETGVFTFLTALAILLFLKCRRSSSQFVSLAAGVFLGLGVMTRTTLVIFVPFALAWLLFFAGLDKREAIQKTAVAALGFALIVSPWLVRNSVLLASPTFSTLSGLTLWAGNNPYTFSNYPDNSIDRSVDKAWDELPREERLAIKQLSSDEVGQNSWFISKALAYIKEHPGETLKRAFLKLGAAFSWKQNPARPGFVQTVYFLSYFPVLLLGIVGALMARKRWKEHSLIYGLFVSFAIVTAIFFAHTSHRVYLDVYLLIFGAYALTKFLDFWMFRRSQKPA
jgi:4-amino-4-deoxy-L-arabinose transferase-like glycosyltransferase